jgi:hypothetical protein
VPLDLHFETCAECSLFLKTQLALHSAFSVLAHDVPDSPNLEAPLLAEFDATRHSASTRFRRWLPVVALAACLVVIVMAIHRRPVVAPRIVERPFIEIPYTAPLAPYERTSIVRMDVPVAALIAAGFEVHVPDAGAALRADVLFGQDGRAHAIRPITNYISYSQIRRVTP